MTPTRCVIAGGGPAGVMLGFLLARAGIDVTVLEKHADFFRDFRGDTVHPSTLDVIAELGLTNTRHDVVCLHLHDPRESELPDAGLVTIEDAETGELLELNSTRSSVREKFAAVNAGRLAELDRALIRTGVDTLRLKTTEPFAPVLQRFFEIRRGRRRG